MKIISKERWNSLTEEERKKVESEELEELLARFRDYRANPTDPVFALQSRQFERRWSALPLTSRIYRQLRCMVAKVPLLE